MVAVNEDSVVGLVGVMLMVGDDGIPFTVKSTCSEELRPSVSVTVTTSVYASKDRLDSIKDDAPELSALVVECDVPLMLQSIVRSVGRSSPSDTVAAKEIASPSLKMSLVEGEEIETTGAVPIVSSMELVHTASNPSVT